MRKKGRDAGVVAVGVLVATDKEATAVHAFLKCAVYSTRIYSGKSPGKEILLDLVKFQARIIL